VTDVVRPLAVLALALPAALVVLLWCLPGAWTSVLARLGAVPTAVSAVTAGALVVADPTRRVTGDWLTVDPAGGVLLVVIGVVGLVSVLVSPAYLHATSTSLVRPRWRERTYYSVVNAFWAALLAVPLAGSLGAAWLLVEATTAASALLVGFSGRPRSLEAAWKYLVLTSLGLGVALLGIVLLAAGIPGAGVGALTWGALSDYAAGPQGALVAYLLLLAGLASKIGWAPVHNWLPDAHSEAPAPVSALLSAALLPAVLLVAWRCQLGLAPVVGVRTSRDVLLGFGLLSVLVSVPFLARSLAWKRLLAYSSLEHMGVIAVGLAFASPLAVAGVTVHVVAHAVAKSLGFFLVTPLLAQIPDAARNPVSGVARTRPVLGAAIGLCLATLSGMPPSPLFVSEVLIVAGGIQAGRPWAAAAVALALALVFVCLTRALLETTVGEVPDTPTPAVPAAGPTGAAALDTAPGSPGPGSPDTAPASGPGLPGLRAVRVLVPTCLVLLLVLSGVAVCLPGSGLVHALMEGIS
jgi:hydrogenase-4 component F